MYSVGKLARRFGLSRSTLLHYDRIGLLHPSARSASNYRCYSAVDAERLERIVAYREAGLPLKIISELMSGDAPGKHQRVAEALEQRLLRVNQEIRSLRLQQQTIVELLGQPSIRRQTRLLNKEQWVELLRASGLDEPDMWRWHAEFERRAPEAHQDFLEALGIDDSEIDEIRRHSGQRT